MNSSIESNKKFSIERENWETREETLNSKQNEEVVSELADQKKKFMATDGDVTGAGGAAGGAMLQAKSG